jgi:RNA polymerase sigma-70 factor (ECF subfamily)
MLTSTGSSASMTNWSLIFDAARGGDMPAVEARDQLVRRYWPAVYAFIRKTGRDVHEAADLTQGFVCDVVIGRNIFDHADPKRGRFRNLLLNALKNYIREQHRNETRIKRGGEAAKPLALEKNEYEAVEVHSAKSPEGAFDAQWNATLIRRVLERVRAGCLASGQDVHWAVFEARVVRPMLFGETRGGYSALIERFQLNGSGQAANMMITVKRRFARELFAEISQTVSDPAETEEEVRALLRDLERHT